MPALSAAVAHAPETPQDSSSGSYRILSLDGGGTVGGYVEVRALIDQFGEDTHGHEVLRQFDEVFATSAGCLVASGLAANYTLSEIRAMLESSEFLGSVYAAKSKKIAKTKVMRPSPFIQTENDKGLGATLKGFIVAATEVTTGGFYSTERKTEFLRKVLNHEVESDHPACQAVPCLGDKQGTGEEDPLHGLGDKKFSEIPMLIGENYQGKPVHLTYVCENGLDRKLNLVTTRAEVSAEEQNALSALLNQGVNVITGDKTNFDKATSASPNPRPFFDRAVRIGDYDCYDGGMTGHNCPMALGIKSAMAQGVQPKDLSVLSLGVGPREIKLASRLALKNFMTYASSLWDTHFNEQQALRMQETQALVSAKQIVRIAPIFDNPQDPFNYVSTMLQSVTDIGMMKKTFGRYTHGEISNQSLSGNATYEDSCAAGRALLGLNDCKNAAPRPRTGSQKYGDPVLQT